MNQRLSEMYWEFGKEWVQADKLASLLEETKTAKLSQMKKALGDIPDSRAETQVKASQEWTALVTEMVEARAQANLLRVKLAQIKMASGEQNNESANRRAEMRL